MKDICFPVIFAIALRVAEITVFMWQFWLLALVAVAWAIWPENQP